MINKLLWKLLRRHASPSQMAGFFLANLIGTTIILIGLLFYRDIIPLFGQDDGLFKKEYLVTAKHISTLGGLAGRSSAFEAKEINELSQQPFVKDLGAFTPSLFKVRAGVGMPSTGLRLSTDMFFESVPTVSLTCNPKTGVTTASDAKSPSSFPATTSTSTTSALPKAKGCPGFRRT